MPTRKVTITLTSKIVGHYEARSYPHDSFSDLNFIELYKVPIYEIIITGTDASGNKKTFFHQAPRFMPYWNDPKKPDPHYKTLGWVNSGLSSARTIEVSRYIKNYAVRNRYSPGRGAIVLKDAFYIHAGPGVVSDYGFGSAGCVEIIGNYDDFKSNIASLSGSSSTNADDAIQNLVNQRNLVVIIEAATAPNIKNLYSRKVTRKSMVP